MNKDENGALARSSPALAKLADDNASLEQQRGVAIANAAPIAGPGNYGGLPPSPAPAEVNAPGAPNASGYGGYGGAGSFDQAKSEYDKGRYTSAYAGFSALAANDPNSALWAARTKQAISGPAGAAREFDQLAQRLSGTTYGYSATLEGARCYRLMGAYDVAREHLSRLRGVPSFDTQAQNELDLINAAIAHPQAPAATATASAPANATRQ